MFAVIHELLDHSDKEYYTEYEPDGKKNNNENNLIIPGISEPPARTLRATVPENERHIFR